MEPRPGVHARWMKAMRSGDFEAAWRATDELERARRARRFRCAEAGELVWDGSPFAGRRVLVRCLHGLGDTLQFIRFVPALTSVASAVTVAIQPALVPLFRPHSDFGEVCDGWTDRNFPHDVEVEVMELAYALRALASTLPRPPYLDREWICERAKLRPSRRCRRMHIGLVWAASGWDETRSIPPHELAPLAEIDADFFSLQQGADPAEVPLHFVEMGGSTAEVIDAARAMLSLDLVITVDAMPAHLAGALGVPVWLLLKRDCDWRWMDRRDDSPWYPSMRVFRQERPGDWSAPIAAVAARLSEGVRRGDLWAAGADRRGIVRAPCPDATAAAACRGESGRR